MRVDPLIENEFVVPEEVEEGLEILRASIDEESSSGINGAAPTWTWTYSETSLVGTQLGPRGSVL